MVALAVFVDVFPVELFCWSPVRFWRWLPAWKCCSRCLHGGYRLRPASDAPQSLLSRELHGDCEYCRALVYPCSQILYVAPLSATNSTPKCEGPVRQSPGNMAQPNFDYLS